MLDLTQDDRNAQLTTPLGKDVLLMRRLDGTEGLSEPFEFRIEAFSEEEDIDLKKIIGEKCSVKFTMGETSERYFHGYATEARWLGFENRLHRYEVVLRPWFWLLTRVTDSRIFKDMTVTDIIKKVFNDAGFTDFEDKTTGSYPTLHYTVQYMETHFNFCSRMMEKFGIYYYFKHEDSKHTLVLADGISSHSAVPDFKTVPYHDDANVRNREKEHISQWSTAQSLRTGKAVYKDYAYERASSDIKDDHQELAGHSKDNLELYVYPGGYAEKADGKKLATYRIQAEHAQTSRRFAAGNVPCFFPGGLFTMEKHPAGGQNKEYLLVRATHTIVNSEYYSLPNASPHLTPYHGAYECLESSVQFRAPIRTPRALIPGPQTAIVIGADGEEIDVDDKGRILVNFYWDRYKSGSKRLRIAQGMAGKGWGMQYTPRIKHEVVIGYVEGDPDQPFVCGAVYNSDNDAPISLPADKTRSTWMSDSSKDADGFNEIRFEDKAGSEEVWMHAQKDMNVKVLNDKNVEVLNDETLTVTKNRTQKIKEGNETLEITQGDQTFDIKQGKRTTTINGNDTFTVKQGNWANTVKMGNVTTTLNMGNMTNTLKLGNQTNKMNVGSHTTDALSGITLKCGASKISMTPASIEIKAPMVTIKADAICQVQGTMTTVKGAAILTLGGGMMMIG